MECFHLVTPSEDVTRICISVSKIISRKGLDRSLLPISFVCKSKNFLMWNAERQYISLLFGKLFRKLMESRKAIYLLSTKKNVCIFNIHSAEKVILMKAEHQQEWINAIFQSIVIQFFTTSSK